MSAVSASHFQDDNGDTASQASEPGSHSSAQSSLSELGDKSMQATIHMVLHHLQLEIPQQAESAPESTFLRSRWAPTAFAVAPSEEYLRELYACWGDTGAHSCLSTDGQALKAMYDSARVGWDSMPVVEPTITSFIVF